jgi:hypothetical protein
MSRSFSTDGDLWAECNSRSGCVTNHHVPVNNLEHNRSVMDFVLQGQGASKYEGVDLLDPC